MATNNYCLVGYGNHSVTKLLPALEKLKKNIMGIVSTSNRSLDNKHMIFRNLEEAISKSDNSTVFIIATPPSVHLSQIKMIIAAERNVFVEKPIFISTRDVLDIESSLSQKKLFVVESMMFKHTFLYSKFLEYWVKYKKNIIKLECFFLIPSLPLNTFRDELSIFSSPLYDMGCYIITLLIDLGYKLKNLRVEEVLYKKNKIEKIVIKNTFGSIEFLIEFGLGKKYQNSIKLSSKDSQFSEFSPFFYGREGMKKISSNCNNIFIEDFNAFEEMFRMSNNFWLSNQKKRFIKLKKVNMVLEDLSDQISNYKFN